MKRPTALILASFVVLVLLFSAYLFFAPQPSATHQAPLTASTRRTATGPTGSLGTGEGAWVKQFDEHTGKLSSQFRGSQYDRQPDGTMKVASPQAEFYLSDGQILRLEGETGIVAISESLRPGKDQVFGGPSKPPTRGDMKDVHIRLFKDATSTTPTLTCVMDNATFDNETFRIFTQAAVIDGKNVAADEIPVTLEGVDYDFDGRGLTIRLNQRDRRLEYLEVTHGHFLTIKNPSKLNENLTPAGPATMQSLLPPSQFEPALPFMFATTDELPPIPKRPTTAAKSPRRTDVAATSRPVAPSIYRADFRDNVRVHQSDQDLATGDRLQIDFLFDDNSSSSSATTRKSRTSKSTPAATAKGSQTPRPSPAAPAATDAVSPVAPSPQATSNPQPATSQPASRPTQPPVTIFWTGKLTLSPTPPSDESPSAKNSIVHIIGTPLHVRQGPSTITGSALLYRTATQHLTLLGTDGNPLTLNDGKGAIVHGTSIEYHQQERIATLDGPGSAVKTLPAQTPADQPKTLSSSWSRSATLFFTGQPNEPLRIETAKLAGNVNVQHPQLNLTAGNLKLDFDPAATTRPAATTATKPADKGAAPDFTASDLRHLDATGNVHATVIGSNNRPQSISADHLALDTASTPDGRIYPKTLIADGSVVAQDPDQQLRAGHLKTALLPTTQPSAGNKQPATDSVPIELEHLTATDAVSVKTADGVTATATRLDVDVDPATRQQHVRLLGSPAHVTSKENAVTGPYIEILPADETYHVRGPGQMHLLQRETPQSKPRPVDVAWQDSVAVDGKKNVIDVLGGVTVVTTDDNNTRNNAAGDHLTITLAPAPAAPTTRKATTKKAQPLTGIASSGDPMQNKTVQTITFQKGATLESVQTDKQTNDLLKQMNLIADVVSYDLPHKRVTVPVPGEMLVVNRPGTTTAPAKQSSGNGLGGSRGTTAFSWTHDMVFDQSANIMIMTGDVVIAHESDGSDDKPFRLDADKVTAILAPKQQTAGTTAPPTDAIELKHVLAEGAIRFTSKDTQLTASSVDYDPATGILIARSQGRDPVELFDPDGVHIGSATEVHFNTKTGQSLKMTDVQVKTRRRQ